MSRRARTEWLRPPRAKGDIPVAERLASAAQKRGPAWRSPLSGETEPGVKPYQVAPRCPTRLVVVLPGARVVPAIGLPADLHLSGRLGIDVGPDRQLVDVT